MRLKSWLYSFSLSLAVTILDSLFTLFIWTTLYTPIVLVVVCNTIFHSEDRSQTLLSTFSASNPIEFSLVSSVYISVRSRRDSPACNKTWVTIWTPHWEVSCGSDDGIARCERKRLFRLNTFTLLSLQTRSFTNTNGGTSTNEVPSLWIPHDPGSFNSTPCHSTLFPISSFNLSIL